MTHDKTPSRFLLYLLLKAQKQNLKLIIGDKNVQNQIEKSNS